MANNSKYLTKRSIKAGLWLAGYRFFARFINLLKTPIIARILTPEQFGVFGIVSITLNLFETFSETGLEQALIHKKNLDHKDINTAWFLTLCRSVLITFGIFITAPMVAGFFGRMETIPMIQLIALTPIFRALRNPTIVLYKRKLAFKRETVMLGVGSIAEVVVAVVLTVYLKTEWALVWAIVAGSVSELVISYLIFSLPQITTIDLKVAKKLIGFGKWVWSSSILSYLANQGDDIVVGRVLGSAPLGLYQNAYKMASLPATQISGTITQVTFPAFASIQDDHVRLLRAFWKSLWFTCITTIPLSILIFVAARPLTLIIFGENWLALVPALRILSIYGVARSIANALGPLAIAIGKPDLVTMSGVVRTVFLFLLIYPLSVYYGIEGASWATVVGVVASNIYLYWKLRPLVFGPK